MTTATRRRGPLQYPIRVAARMTGLSVDTLRAWERRYQAVLPRRSDRGRLYGEEDVTRLRQLRQLVERGHAIGTVAHLNDEKLERLLLEGDKLGAPSMPAPGIVDLTPIVEALDRYDLAAIEAMLSSYGVVLTPHGLVFSVVLPLLREVGNRWAAGTLRPAQEHLVSAIVRSVLGALLRANARHDALPKIVFATPAGERHELGLLCAALIAAAKGYGVVYLGPDLPSADIWHATAKSDARVVILSLTASGSVPKTELRTINKPPTGVEVWVGGPAADSLLTMAGSSTRRIDDLEGLVTLLDTHAR